MNQNNSLENTLRKFTLEKLQALASILELDSNIMTTTTISGALDQKDKQLGARISSLSRTKIDGKQLLIPSGRGEEGLHWRLNTEIAPKEDMKSLVEEILRENSEFY